MNLPEEYQEKILLLYAGLDKQKLIETRSGLTEKYKNKTGNSTNKISTKEDGIIYAISRMPATYAVTQTLLETLIQENKIENVHSIFDFGSGTGAGYLALLNLFDENQIELFEREDNMISCFNQIFKKQVHKFDLTKDKTESKADLVLCSYVLSEMNDSDRKLALDNLMNSTNNYLLLIDTGTPDVYHKYMQIKDYAKKCGYCVIAPCSGECDLQNDYCQFYARVERNGLMKMAKQGSLSYEDEKYFYLLFSKHQIGGSKRRVIRRPIYEANRVKLVVCDRGKKDIVVTKKDKELYKKARKIKINEEI